MKKILASLCVLGVVGGYAVSAWAGTIGTCVPVEVAAYPGRVHVKCSSKVSGVRYFAASTSNKEFASRIIAIGNTALVSGRSLMIEYNSKKGSGSKFGCRSKDCKALVGIGLK